MSESVRSKNMPDIIVLPVREYAYAIEDTLKPYFNPYPIGVYSETSLTPVLRANAAYKFKIENNRQLAHVPELKGWVVVGKNTRGGVFDPSQDSFSQPQVPVHGLGIVKKFIEARLHSGLKWSNSLSGAQVLHDYLISHFNLDCCGGSERTARTHPIVLESEEFVYAQLRNLAKMIDEYKGDEDEWSMYDVQIGLFSATIKRQGDYRIMDWTEKFGKKFKK